MSKKKNKNLKLPNTKSVSKKAAKKARQKAYKAEQRKQAEAEKIKIQELKLEALRKEKEALERQIEELRRAKIREEKRIQKEAEKKKKEEEKISRQQKKKTRKQKKKEKTEAQKINAKDKKEGIKSNKKKLVYDFKPDYYSEMLAEIEEKIDYWDMANTSGFSVAVITALDMLKATIMQTGKDEFNDRCSTVLPDGKTIYEKIMGLFYGIDEKYTPGYDTNMDNVLGEISSYLDGSLQDIIDSSAAIDAISEKQEAKVTSVLVFGEDFEV